MFVFLRNHFWNFNYWIWHFHFFFQRSLSDASRIWWGGRAEPFLGPCWPPIDGGPPLRLSTAPAASLFSAPTPRSLRGWCRGCSFLPDGASGGGVHANSIPLVAHHRCLFVCRPSCCSGSIVPIVEVSYIYLSQKKKMKLRHFFLVRKM